MKITKPALLLLAFLSVSVGADTAFAMRTSVNSPSVYGVNRRWVLTKRGSSQKTISGVLNSTRNMSGVKGGNTRSRNLTGIQKRPFR